MLFGAACYPAGKGELSVASPIASGREQQNGIRYLKDERMLFLLHGGEGQVEGDLALAAGADFPTKNSLPAPIGSSEVIKRLQIKGQIAVEK